MSRGLLYRYLIPDEVNYVMLRALSVYGWMESGKTTLSLKIASRVEEEVGDRYGFICLFGRRQSDVLRYVEENRDTVRGNSYIVMIYDDAARYYMSRESARRERREELKDFMEIRHIFESLGVQRGVIIPIFNVQYYSLLDKTLRNVPAGIWKSMVLMDRGEKREFILNIGWKYYYLLKVITKAMYLDRYIFMRSEVSYPRGTRGEQIYTWIREFFIEKGAQEADGGVVLNRDFVKRFGLLVLLGDRAIVDFGTEIKKPKNLIEVKPQEDDRWFMPQSLEEKRKILWWAGLVGYYGGLTLEEVRDFLRGQGLSFSNDSIAEVWSTFTSVLNSVKKRRRRKKVKAQVFKLAEIASSP